MEQLLDVELLTSYIKLVETNQVAAVHLHATLCEHPFLIGNVAGIDQQVFWCVLFLALIGAALHLVDVPSVTVLAQDIDGTIASPSPSKGRGERSLADILHTLLHPHAGLLYHLTEVETAVRLLGISLLVVAKEFHGQIAYLISLFETCLQSLIDGSLLRLIDLQPENLRTLAESRVSRF